MIQLFKRNTRLNTKHGSDNRDNNISDNSISDNSISDNSNNESIREIVIVNKQLDDEWLMTITNCNTDDDDDVRSQSQFTISTRTNQLNTLIDILEHNGYKQGLEGLDVLLTHEYNTYENGERIATNICSRLTLSKLIDKLKRDVDTTHATDYINEPHFYIRLLPHNTTIMHFNGVLRDNRGQKIYKSNALIKQLQELYNASCAFDLIASLDPNDDSYTIIDFAYDAEYSKRRRLFYEFNLDNHLDIPIDNTEQLLQTISKSIMNVDVKERSLNLSGAYNFIIHSPESMYVFDGVKSDAYMMKVYSSALVELGMNIDDVNDNISDNISDNDSSTNTLESSNVISQNMNRDNIEDTDNGRQDIERKRDSEIRSICIKRGVLV